MSLKVHEKINKRGFYEQTFGKSKVKTRQTKGRHKFAKRRLSKSGSFYFKAGKIIK